MCRLLLIKSKDEFDISKNLKIFSKISKNSKEYQGHGWGCSYLDENNNWQHYKNILPIWEDNLGQFKKTKFLVAHARSAFKDKGITVENNMPFHDDKFVFIFNGELHGVRIKEEGRIGAEKIFNFIRKHENGDIVEAFVTAISLINRNTRYVRGMNIILASKNKVYLNSTFGEDLDYFTVHYKETSKDLFICSKPFPNEADWETTPNNTMMVW